MLTIDNLTTDLDSDSDIPLRELFGMAGMIVPLMLLRHYAGSGLSAEETLLVVGWIYVAIRYGFSVFYLLLASIVIFRRRKELGGFLRDGLRG